jgi:hypothetical protein
VIAEAASALLRCSVVDETYLKVAGTRRYRYRSHLRSPAARRLRVDAYSPTASRRASTAIGTAFAGTQTKSV